MEVLRETVRCEGCYVDSKEAGKGEKGPLQDCWVCRAGLSFTLLAKESAHSFRLEDAKDVMALMG